MHIVPNIVYIVRNTTINIGYNVIQRIVTCFTVHVACENGILVIKHTIVHSILDEKYIVLWIGNILTL